MLKNRLPTDTPFDSAPGEATVVPRTVTVRHRALPRLMNFASARRPTIQRVWPAVGAAVTPVASIFIAPASLSMKKAACSRRACSWVFKASGSLTAFSSRFCRSRATPGSPAS